MYADAVSPQGYHDIVSVLFLSLPEESLMPAVEKMSLHRLRDSMGDGLEPMIGQLRSAALLAQAWASRSHKCRIMKRLLRLADPDFASMVERCIVRPGAS